jgi:pimeloyl-ACP methyl ester carboxylesterase
MSYANNQGVNIYYEVEGQGPALVFAHGATGNLDAWRNYGYVDRLKNHYTLILFDLRGHGRSDKPHAVEAYHYRLQASDVIAVLDTLQVGQTHFWGYSLGATIGFALAKHYPQRIHSLILGGSSPYSEVRPLTEPPSRSLQIMRNGIQGGANVVVQGARELFGEITPHYEARLRNLDYQAQAALMEYLDYHLPSLEDVLPTMNMPCLVYMADDDDPKFVHTQEYVKQMPNATFLGIPGHNHLTINTDLDAFVPQILDFLATVP